jgi:Flp pilus assembly protein TadD
LLEELVRIKPQDAGVHADLGAVYAEQHLREKALSQIETAAALIPGDAEVSVKIAEAYEYLGDRHKAIESVVDALQRGYPLTDLDLTPNLQSLLRDPAAKAAIAKMLNAS